MRLSRLALVVLVLAGAAALVWWRGPSVDLLGDVFTAVAWQWVAAAVAVNLLSVVVRAAAWRAVIDQAMPPPHPSSRAIFSAFSIGLLGNAALPGRIGELARVAVLVNRLPRQRGLWATLAGTVFAHRVFDLVAVMLLILYVAVGTDVPRWAETSLSLFAGLAGALLVVALVLARRHQLARVEGLGRVRRLVAMGQQGLGVMRAPLPAAVAVLLQVLGWTAQLFAVYATMRAFRIDEALAAAGVVLLVMNVATVFPLWPGNIGLMQAAVALALVPYGIAYAHGFAFGLGLQAIEASVGVGLGLLFLAREGLTFATLRRMPEPAEEAGATDAPARPRAASSPAPGASARRRPDSAPRAAGTPRP